MYYQSALLAAALTGMTAATYNAHQLNGVRSLQAGAEGGNSLPRRQDAYASVSDSDSASASSALACQESVFAILGDLPTPTPALVSYLLSFAATADPTDPAALCAVTSALPTSLASAYSSYDQAASSWYSGHSAEMAQLASDCAGDVAGAGGAQALTQAITALESYTAGDCTGTLPTGAAGLTSMIPLLNATATATATNGSGVGVTAAPTGGATPPASGTGSSIVQGAAARPTGVIAGAMAAAGLLGVVAML
ncbi:hypothetical protein SLS62_005321 [Diatrype stigma]|uniref:DUF7735 domain-containing protein n=1 Tax=Diatrype stigma TaxID=117547 RepID=A0AAN9UPE1_9PEZI